MKKFIVFIIMMLCLGVNNSNSQNVVREGKVFKQVNKSIGHKADTLITGYVFEDSKNNKYPIIINKNSGSCYIWKKSSKSGRMYKQYMKSDMAKQIARELNIEYKSKSKK